MNHPTWEDFHRLESEQKRLREEHEVLKRRLEQRTEEMKAIRVDVASKDVLDRLDELEQKINTAQNDLEQKLDSVQENTNRVTIQMEGARADILKLGESQADLRDKLIEHGEDLKAIKEKQEAHSDVLAQLIAIGEDINAKMATKEDLKTMATKDDIKDMATKTDISALKTDIDSIKSTQEQILNLLQERGK